jgi:hypothetical protein
LLTVSLKQMEWRWISRSLPQLLMSSLVVLLACLIRDQLCLLSSALTSCCGTLFWIALSKTLSPFYAMKKRLR